MSTKTSKSKALILASVKLPAEIAEKLAQPTPKEFIKSKPGRGGKQVMYVEVGYTTAKLNEVFGPINWDFKVVERGETNRALDRGSTGEVWVYGELSIKDHQRGYVVTKGAYGQHPVHANVPMGDCLKAAESDALKKAASMFGIALDVYWKQELIDESAKVIQKVSAKDEKAKVPVAEPTLLEKAKEAITEASDPAILRQYLERVDMNPNFTMANRFQLKKLIKGKLQK